MVSIPKNIIKTGRKKNPKKDATCWEKGHGSAMDNLNESLSDWNAREEAVDPESFKSSCWRPRKVRGERHFEIWINVSGRKADLSIDDDGKPQTSFIVPMDEVHPMLMAWRNEVADMTKGSDNITAKSIHKLAVAIAEPKAKDHKKSYDKSKDKWV